MIQNVEKSHTILIKGPSRINILEGKVEVFGKIFSHEKAGKANSLIIPSATIYPIYALEPSKLEIYISNKDNLNLIEENTINKEWSKIKDIVIDEIKKNQTGNPLKIMVLGISSGKTTLIKYIANNLLKEGLTGGYLDSDLGQQIMYLPTTLNIGEIKDFIISSSDINAEETVFIGSTFPKSNFKFIVAHSCRSLIDKYNKSHKNSDFILIDSDGWIKTEAGVIYKNFFINTIDPDILIIFHDDSIEELKEIEKNASKSKNRKLLLIKEENRYFFEKNKDERRFLRQSQFAKILEGFRKISIPLNDIKFIKTDYDKEKDEVIEIEIDVNDLVTLPYHYVIISLMTEDSKMIKIGLLFVINLEKNYVLLYSDFNFKEQNQIKKILLGSLRLSTKGNHQGYLYL
ncbi:MAG: Clp1/GlmU family protein [Promethearchaeota archaeon]|jgi:polynucleotide 5'-kinase involved in rRNA processing